MKLTLFLFALATLTILERHLSGRRKLARLKVQAEVAAIEARSRAEREKRTPRL